MSVSGTRKPSDDKLSRWSLLAFALPAAPISAMGLPLIVHLPPFYAGFEGMTLAMVGTIFMLARFWDMITDPILGVVSDKFETRWGRRRHWIVLSVPIMMVSVYFVFMPPADVSFAYLMTWLFILYIGWTLLTLSHISWGAELTPDYHERSRVQGWRELLLVGGMVFVLLMPALIEALGEFGSQAELYRARVSAMAWFILILLPLTVAIAVMSVPERKTTKPKAVPWRDAIGIIFKNGPLRYVLACDLLGGISGGIVASMFLFLAEDALQLHKFSSFMLLGYFISGVLFIMPILALTKRVGKHKAAAYSSAFNGATVLLILLVPPGQPWVALFVWALCGVNMAAGPFLFRAIMADVADHDTVHSHQQRTGLFFALLTMTSKLGSALAVFGGYWLLGQIGFEAGGENSQATLDWLRGLYVYPASVISFAVAAIMWFYPIDEKMQIENRRILEQRGLDAVAAGIEVITGEAATGKPGTTTQETRQPAE